MSKTELIELLNELTAIAKTRLNLYYLKSLFDFTDYSFEEFQKAYKHYSVEDNEIKRKFDKLNEMLESRIVEAALNGKITSSLAQLVLINKFNFENDKQQRNYNIKIVYEQESNDTDS